MGRSLVCAVFTPALTAFMLAAPKTFILALGGIAVLVLQRAFVTAFAGSFSPRCAAHTFVVYLELTIFNISAAFWGIVIGYVISRLLEPGDYAEGLNRK